MAKNELIDRLHRIYAAIDETVEGDLAQFSPKVISNDKAFAIYQDFLGGLNAAQLSNLAHGVIHNIANLEDHFRRWARKNGHDPQRIATVFKNSLPLQIVKDLANNDKHGYPPRDGGHSGKLPKLAEVNRVLRMTTRVKAGSFVRMVLTPTGLKRSGDGSAAVVITGQIVDSSGAVIGDLYDTCVEGLKVLELEFKAWGLITQ